jgi:hypothetical protein
MRKIAGYVIFLLYFQSFDTMGVLGDNHANVDPNARRYFDEFLVEAEARNLKIPKERLYIDVIETNDLPETIVGMCVNASIVGAFAVPSRVLGHRIVYLRPKSYFMHLEPSLYDMNLTVSEWMDKAEMQYRSVIWHELGHCLLDLDHSKRREFSLMRPSIFEFTAGEWPILVDELFSRARPIEEQNFDIFR